MVEVRHLRYMVALAKEMNFTAAAKQLHIVQSALSLNIRQIEEELGVKLFARSSRRVTLTSAGEVFYREAVAALEQLERMAHATQRAARGETGTLSIGFTTTTIQGELSTRIRNFHKHYPDTELVIKELPLDVLVETVRTGALDIGCTDSGVLGEGLESISLKPLPVVVILNKAHPLARRSSLRLDMLAKERFIFPMPYRCHPLYDTFVRACREAGFDPIRPYFTESTPAGLALVAANIGITLQHKLPLIHPEVVSRRLTAPRMRIPMQLIWRKQDLSPTAAKFLESA